MQSELARALARVVAVGRGRPVIVREVADVVPRPDAGWLALATMPADGRIWAGTARLPDGETIDLCVLEPRRPAFEREGLRKLGGFLTRLADGRYGEQPGDYPQLIVPDGETTRALELIRARFRADPDPALRRLCHQLAFWLDSARLDGADAYVDLRRLLVDHVAWPLAPAEERHLPRLLACLEPDPEVALRLDAQRTCLPDPVADALSDRLIARSKAIQRGLTASTWAGHEAAVLAALRAHAAGLLDLLERGLAVWARLGLQPADCAQLRTLTDDFRYRRSRWVADEPPFMPARSSTRLAAHDLLKREAAAERRAYWLTLADDGVFETAVLAGEAARAVLLDRPSSRRLDLRLDQPGLRLRHGDPVEVRNLPGVRGTLLETGPASASDGTCPASGAPASDRFALRVDNGVRKLAGVLPGATLELVRRWDGHLTQKRHQCLRLWARHAGQPPAPRRPRPRAADPAGWYATRRSGWP